VLTIKEVVKMFNRKKGAELTLFKDFLAFPKEVTSFFDQPLDFEVTRFFGHPLKSVSLDVSEDKKNIIVKTDLPGIDEKDIKVSVRNGILTISGERKEEKERKDKNFHMIERSFGSFSRSIYLPKSVDEGKLQKSYKDGVFEITMPKKEAVKTK
jgi:HSP20 family protein